MEKIVRNIEDREIERAVSKINLEVIEKNLKGIAFQLSGIFYERKKLGLI